MTVDESDAQLAQVFVELSEALRSGQELVDAMDVLVRACTAHTSAVEAAVILAGDDGTYRAVASTRERTLDVEEAQIGADSGPCLDSIRADEILEVPDIGAEEDRWPVFAATAREAGLGAVLAVPVTVGDRTIAGVNVFLTEPGRLPASEASFIVAMTRVVASNLAQRHVVEEQMALSEQLAYALESRVTIEQAKGYLAYQHGTDVSAAFARLRTYARSNGQALRRVAEAVLDRRLSI